MRAGLVGSNAGVVETSEEDWHHVMAINLTGVWRTMKAAVPHMLSAANGGSIITISSVAGIKALPGAYCHLGPADSFRMTGYPYLTR